MSIFIAKLRYHKFFGEQILLNRWYYPIGGVEFTTGLGKLGIKGIVKKIGINIWLEGILI